MAGPDIEGLAISGDVIIGNPLAAYERAEVRLNVGVMVFIGGDKGSYFADVQPSDWFYEPVMVAT